MSNRTPQFRRYRKTYARVKLNGVWVHLGRYDSPEAKAKYKQLITQWAAAVPFDPPARQAISVAELLAAYLEYARHYYGEDPKSRYYHMRRVVRAVRQLYDNLPAHEFGPKKLQVVRQTFIDRGNCRRQVNDYTRDTVAIFSWGAEQEMIPGSLVHALREVRSLRYGRCDVPEGKTVTAVPQTVVDATLPHLTPVVADMVQLQLTCGARPGEICGLTPGQIDRTGDVWLYRPVQHKTCHLGHERAVCFGPRAQDILRKYLLRPADAPCFSPKEALAQHLDQRHEERATPMSCGNTPSPCCRKRAIKKVHDRYDVAACRRAIERACDRAFPAPDDLKGAELRKWRRQHHWTPHRLRHTCGAVVREH